MKNPKVTKPLLGGAVVLGIGAIGMTTVFAATGGLTSRVFAPVTITVSNSTESPNSAGDDPVVEVSTTNQSKSLSATSFNSTCLRSEYTEYVNFVLTTVEQDLSEKRFLDAQALLKSAQEKLSAINQLVQKGDLASAGSLLHTDLVVTAAAQSSKLSPQTTPESSQATSLLSFPSADARDDSGASDQAKQDYVQLADAATTLAGSLERIPRNSGQHITTPVSSRTKEMPVNKILPVQSHGHSGLPPGKDKSKHNGHH